MKLARNTISGVVVKVSDRHFNHPVLGKNLVEVDEGAKNYIPEMYKPKTAEEVREVQAPQGAGDSVPDETEADTEEAAETPKVEDKPETARNTRK